MRKQNIADYILFDLAKNQSEKEILINGNIISDVVEAWNKNIYLLPHENIVLSKQPKNKFKLM